MKKKRQQLWKSLLERRLVSEDMVTDLALQQLASTDTDRSVALLLMQTADKLGLDAHVSRWREAYNAESYHLALESYLEDFEEREARLADKLRKWDSVNGAQLAESAWNLIALADALLIASDMAVLPKVPQAVGMLLEVAWSAPYSPEPFRRRADLVKLISSLPSGVPLPVKSVLLLGRFAKLYVGCTGDDISRVDDWMKSHPVVADLLARI